MNFPGTDPDAPGRGAVGLLRPLEPLCASALSGPRKLIVGEVIVDSLGKRQRTAALQNLADGETPKTARQRFGLRLSSAAFLNSRSDPQPLTNPGPFPQGEGARLAMLVTVKRARLAHARAAHLPLPQGRGRGRRNPNDECRMTKEARMPNDEKSDGSPSDFGFRHSFVIRHSSFVISPSCFGN